MPLDVRDVSPGLWLWRLEYPGWRPDLGWEQTVTSTVVESDGEVALLDPLARTAPRSSGAATSRRPSSSRSSRGASCRAVLVALYDGRGRGETPLWLPEQRALVFADALTAPAGKLRAWSTPWHEQRALPALRALLELPFEHVIVSHGEPVHDRAAYERALELPAWDG